MYMRLVFRNVKRNLKTYGVYFITLSLIYCLLYGFNGVSNHPGMQNMTIYKEVMARMMEQYMGLLSLGVMLVVAFLVVYATNFVLHRRKKELGLYASLGMENKKIVCIILMETLFVNFASMLIGALLGVCFLRILAQFAMIIYASKYHGSMWYWDKDTFYFLVVVFLLSNLLIGILNISSFRKKNIISFLNGEDRSISKYNKSNNIRYIIELFVGIVVFAGCLKFIFEFISDYGTLSELMDYGYTIIVLIMISVIMIYNSLGNGFCILITRWRGIYFSKLNSFVIRQIMTNLNQNSTAMSLIALSMALSFAVFFTGGSAYETIHKELEYGAPYHLMVWHELGEEKNKYEDDISIIGVLEEDGLDITSYLKDKEEFYLYDSGLKYGELFGYSNYWNTDAAVPEAEIGVISLSDYNRVMDIVGNSRIELNEDEFAINCNYKGTLDKVRNFAVNKPKINIDGKALSFTQVTSETIIMTQAGNNDRGTLIIPDSCVTSLSKSLKILTAKYINEDNSTDITDFLGKWVGKYTYMDGNGIQYEFQFQSKDRMSAMYLGFVGIAIFIMGFVGIIFTIIALSVLSIQMLATSIGMINDYNVLRALGVEEKREARLLFLQIAWYFSMPLIVAVPLGAVGGIFIINYMSDFMNLTIRLNFQYLSWMAIFFIIYLGITYRLCKRIVCMKK